MISSQLGRAILSGSGFTPDEMTGRPEPDGSYGPLDDLIAAVAENVANGATSHLEDKSPSPS